MGLRSIAFALLGAAVATSASAAPISTAEQIRKLEARVNAAYAANDLATYFSFYADDLRALYPEGPTTLPAYKAEWTAFIQGGGAIVSCSYMEVYNESIFDLLQPFKVGLRPQPHASAPPSTAPASL